MTDQINKIKQRKVINLMVLAASLFALVFIAGGLGDIQFNPGKPLNLIEWFFSELESQNQEPEYRELYTQVNYLPEIGDTLLQSLVAIFWLMIVFSILVFFVSPKFRKEMLRTLAFLIPLIILLPQISKSMQQETEVMEGQEGAGAYTLGDFTKPEPPPFVQDPPEWLYFLANTILVLLLLGAAIYLWRRFRPKPEPLAVVVKQVKWALTDLESGSDMRDVIMLRYAQMCKGLQESQGIKRHKAMTPREFESYLSNAGISSIHIQELTRLFEGVRYGAKTSDTATKNQAMDCLKSVLEVYGDA